MMMKMFLHAEMIVSIKNNPQDMSGFSTFKKFMPEYLNTQFFLGFLYIFKIYAWNMEIFKIGCFLELLSHSRNFTDENTR